MISIFFLRQRTAITKVYWDVETVTAGDYAVEISVNRFFKEFKEKEYANYPDDTIGLAFEKFIRYVVEDILTHQVDSQGYEDVDKIRVAEVQFTYKNSKLLKLL